MFPRKKKGERNRKQGLRSSQPVSPKEERDGKRAEVEWMQKVDEEQREKE